MKSSLLFLSRMLMIEQRYQAIKKSPKFVRESPDTVKKKLGNFIRVSYLANSISFSIFSFLLISPYLFTSQDLFEVVNMGFVVYVYALIISIYSSALFFNAIGSMRLLDPIQWLPYRGKKKAVITSWMLYSGSTSFFVIIPSVAWVSYTTGNISAIPFGIMWAAIFILLGYTIGALLNAFIMGRGPGDRATLLNTVKSTMRVLLMLLVFAFFEVGIYLPGMVPDFILGLRYPLDLLIPLVNVPYAVFLGNSTFPSMALDLLSTSLYLILALFLAWRSNSFVIGRSLENSSSHAVFGTDKSIKFRHEGLVRSLMVKDARIVARKSQNVILLFIPVIFVFPTILSVLIYGSPGGVKNIGTYFSLLSILVVCSSFYSLIMVVSEGSGVETLFSLPLSGKDIIYSKSIFGMLIFAVIIIPVTILIIGGSGFSSFDILVPANLILGYAFSSTFNIRRLMGRLPRESTTVNFYSFGGGLFLITMFVITAALALSPVIGSLLVTEAIYRSLFANQYVFYLTDSILNFMALLLVIFTIERSRGSAW